MSDDLDDFIEVLREMGEDPEDRAIREAHGFTRDDDFEDRNLLCRNGCGATYFDATIHKIRTCLKGPAAVQEILPPVDWPARFHAAAEAADECGLHESAYHLREIAGLTDDAKVIGRALLGGGLRHL